VIRVDAAWFAVEPMDMRAGVDTALGRVVSVFGEARAHHAYLFVNKRANRMKVLVHDGFGLWLCASVSTKAASSVQVPRPASEASRCRTSSCKRSSSGCRGNAWMSARRYMCCEEKYTIGP
jgi:transposase